MLEPPPPDTPLHLSALSLLVRVAAACAAVEEEAMAQHREEPWWDLLPMPLLQQRYQTALRRDTWDVHPRSPLNACLWVGLPALDMVRAAGSRA